MTKLNVHRRGEEKKLRQNLIFSSHDKAAVPFVFADTTVVCKVRGGVWTVFLVPTSTLLPFLTLE